MCTTSTYSEGNAHNGSPNRSMIVPKEGRWLGACAQHCLMSFTMRGACSAASSEMQGRLPAATWLRTWSMLWKQTGSYTSGSSSRRCHCVRVRAGTAGVRHRHSTTPRTQRAHRRQQQKQQPRTTAPKQTHSPCTQLLLESAGETTHQENGKGVHIHREGWLPRLEGLGCHVRNRACNVATGGSALQCRGTHSGEPKVRNLASGMVTLSDKH